MQLIKYVVAMVVAFIFSLGVISQVTLQAAQQDEVVIPIVALAAKQTKNGKIEGGWVPNIITVKKGQKVTLKIKGLDVPHIFHIPAFNVTSPEILPGEIVKISFVADKSGKFIFLCHMECGEGHQYMIGHLIVEP